VTRSAVVVVIDAAQEAVGRHRRVHDPMERRGVPPHLTILHPFRVTVDDATAAEIAEIAGRIAPFDASFAVVERFPAGVVYLAPSPADTFKRITAQFVEAFPDCPPYRGAYPDPIPHLTVGTGFDESAAGALAATLADDLPISTTVDRLTLLVEDDRGQWTVDRHWLLTGQAAL